jgi:hypothetical protein
MSGGLLSLAASGNENIEIYGNPSKSLFIAKYKKISNFSMQKFRIDAVSSRELNFNGEVNMDFDIKRYADLLYDTYLCVNIPDIWSSLYIDASGNYIERGFKWIEELGSNIIKEIRILAGGREITKFSGEYLSNIAQRDYSKAKINLWNKMTGNIAELNDPANAFDRINIYPNVLYNTTTNIRPSILGRKLYIPIDAWFGLSTKTALPLCSLQYDKITISITFRAIKDLYTIRDVQDNTNLYPYISPNPNNNLHQISNFINPPENINGTNSSSNDQWNSDIHLISTYVFLDKNEALQITKNEYNLLIKYVYEREFLNVVGSTTSELNSIGLISNYMFRFRRSDVNLRNTWSNYTNFPYKSLPYQVTNLAPPNNDIFVTGNYTTANFEQNNPHILKNLSILFDGKERENNFDSGIYNYIEKFNNTSGDAKDGIYIYSFATNTNLRNYQPTGASNLDKFENIQFRFNTLEPPLTGPGANSTVICGPDGNVVGTRKNMWELNEYTYDLKIFEERYNVLTIMSGQIGLKYQI